MKRYSHTWWGLGLLFFFMVVLLTILPSRAALLLNKYTLPTPSALTGMTPPAPDQSTESRPPRDPHPPAGASGSPAEAPEGQAAVREGLRPPAEPGAGAFTLDFGAFVTAREADDVERRLNQLGASTVRYRTRSAGRLFAVKIGRFASPAQARDAMEQLKLRHPTLPLGKLEREAESQVAITVDGLHPLREAVTLAAQLRTGAFPVRLEAAREAAPLFRLRLATAYDLETAREKSREFRGHGLPNAVVPAARPALP